MKNKKKERKKEKKEKKKERKKVQCKFSTVKPRYSAPAFNIVPPIKHTNFGPKKYFHSYLYVGNN